MNHETHSKETRKSTLSPLLRARSFLRILGLGLASAGVMAPQAAMANPLFETFGAINSPNAFTARILATGAEAAYFNPSLLPKVDEGLSLGVFLLVDPLDIELMDRPAGADISEDIYRAVVDGDDGQPHPVEGRSLATSALDPRNSADKASLRSYLNIGVAKHLIDDYLSLGLIVVLPMSTFQEQTSRFSDERQQFFANSLEHELYGDRFGQLSVGMGLGGAITDWVSWGAGVTLGLSTGTVNPVYVPDASDQSNVIVTANTSVDTTFAPHFGLTFNPIEALSLGLTYHAPSKTETRGTNRMRIWNFNYDEGDNALVSEFKFVNSYEPMTAALGAAMAFPEADGGAWHVGTEIKWRKWSDYIDRANEQPVEPWSDTFEIALGGRYETSEKTRFHLDAAWTPSPVPDQIGAQNYVDEDRLGFSAGMEADMDIFGLIVRGSIGLQVQRLLPRTTLKDPNAADPVRDEFPDDAYDLFTGETFPSAQGLQTNNPGWPGWTASGWLIGAGINLKVSI